MATVYRDRDYAPDYRRRGSGFTWAALLLVPLFFLFGWVANDYFQTGTTGPEAGVGGAPFTEDETTQPVRPTVEPTPAAENDQSGTDDLSPTPRDDQSGSEDGLLDDVRDEIQDPPQ